MHEPPSSLPPLASRDETPAFFRPVFLARLFFILLMVWCAVTLAEANKVIQVGDRDLQLFGVTLYERPLFSAVALVIALLIVVFEHATDAISSHKILMAALGMTVGLFFSSLFYTTIPVTVAEPQDARTVCNLLFGYFGIILAIKHAERFHLSRLKFFLSQAHERPKVLDTSVIIDGRISELIDLKVIGGTILVPDFVVREIQNIADSNEPNRRARGRRGLDILEAMQQSTPSLELIDRDYPEFSEVDQKLVHLSREMDADLITNDYNLQKNAQIHKIRVININEIANALRPAVYIGEPLRISIVREGKEFGQGVGYLDDGTMVVVDDANRYIGQVIDVVVSSILQTSSGRLVFARRNGPEADANEEGAATPQPHQQAGQA